MASVGVYLVFANQVNIAPKLGWNQTRHFRFHFHFGWEDERIFRERSERIYDQAACTFLFFWIFFIHFEFSRCFFSFLQIHILWICLKSQQTPYCVEEKVGKLPIALFFFFGTDLSWRLSKIIENNNLTNLKPLILFLLNILFYAKKLTSI